MRPTAKCPACRGRMDCKCRDQYTSEAIVPYCTACGWSPSFQFVDIDGECDIGLDYLAAERRCLEACAPLAYHDERDRLPTEAEEAVLTALYGPRAGWAIRQVANTDGTPCDSPPEFVFGFRHLRQGQARGARFVCWPHVGGRAVKGPGGW